ncbi:MAG: TOBE domain-containing protein [bacterium]
MSSPLVAQEDIPNILQVTITSHQPDKGLTIGTIDKIDFILPHLKCYIGEKLLLNMPASEIILSTAEPENLSASNIFKGTITTINQLEERIFVDADIGICLIVEIVPATVKRLALTKGKEVFLIMKASSFRRLG